MCFFASQWLCSRTYAVTSSFSFCILTYNRRPASSRCATYLVVICRWPEESFELCSRAARPDDPEERREGWMNFGGVLWGKVLGDMSTKTCLTNLYLIPTV